MGPSVRHKGEPSMINIIAVVIGTAAAAYMLSIGEMGWAIVNAVCAFVNALIVWATWEA